MVIYGYLCDCLCLFFFQTSICFLKNKYISQQYVAPSLFPVVLCEAIIHAQWCIAMNNYTNDKLQCINVTLRKGGGGYKLHSIQLKSLQCSLKRFNVCYAESVKGL